MGRGAGAGAALCRLRRDDGADENVVVRRELAANGDRIIVTAGVPFDLPGTTNLLKVEIV